MEHKKYLISPVAAIGTSVVAAVAVVAAITMRPDAPAPAPEVCESQLAPPATPATPPAAPNVAAPVDDVVTPAGPPKIEAVKAKAAVGKLGVDLELEVALTLAAPLTKREAVMAKASCKLDGEWYSGVGLVYLAKAPAGTSVVPARVAIGRAHAFTTPPTECHVGFEYSSYAQRPAQRAWLAKMCWDGTRVTDQPCAPDHGEAAVTVSALRVETSRVRRLGGPVDLAIALDAQLARPLDDWRIEIAADCTLPDGSKHHASERMFTSDVHAGRPFTSRAYLFHGPQQMLDVPQSCTLAVELADRQQLVREPVSAWCWRGDQVASGACG